MEQEKKQLSKQPEVVDPNSTRLQFAMLWLVGRRLAWALTHQAGQKESCLPKSYFNLLVPSSIFNLLDD